MNIDYIETDEQLTRLCKQLKSCQWLAVDTEFYREKTYHAELCLIQLANDDMIACVDPINIHDLTPLLNICYRPGITLVFHAARQDLELFYLLRKDLPQQIFDTQLAATVLGYGNQIGYGNLVRQCLGIDLEKAHTRTDWRQRPLTQGQIHYAANDVRYLCSLYQLLLQQLNESGRLEWLNDDFAELSERETYITRPQDYWRKIKGAGKLKGRQLAILQQLASWREQLAQQQNLPRKWILRDEIMLDLARFAPQDIEKLSKIRKLNPRSIQRHGKAIIEIITAGKNLPAEQWPALIRPEPLSKQQEALLDVLMAIVRKACAEQSISPIAVASRKDLESLLRDEDIALKYGWRQQVVGQQLVDFLQGKISLRCERRHLLLDREK